MTIVERCLALEGPETKADTRSGDRLTDGGALHSALELARVSTPMNLCRYGARIDATPRGRRDVQYV